MVIILTTKIKLKIEIGLKQGTPSLNRFIFPEKAVD